MPKRLAVFAYDTCALLLVAFLLSFAFATPALAYVDPSVMTYTIQALAGVAVALSAVAGVALRRTRKALLKALDIDENAKKTVEPVVHRIDQATGEAVHNTCDDVVNERLSRKRESKASKPFKWPARFGFALLASFFAAGTLLLVAPIEIIGGSISDLTVGLNPVAWIMLIVTLAVTLVLALVVSILPGRAFNVAMAILTAFGTACWVEAMFLNSALPAADGSIVVWENYDTASVISLAAWLAIFVVCIVVSQIHQRLGRAVLSFVCCALILVQGIGVGVLLADVSQKVQNGRYDLSVTEEGMFTVSEKNNIIVFCLDTTDTALLLGTKNSHPDMVSELTGFTMFRDSAGSLIPTRFGVPYLLTGKMPQHGESFESYFTRRYEESSFIHDIHESGYSVGVYTDTMMNGRPYLVDDTINITKLDPWQLVESGVLNIEGTIKVMTQCALYRDLPWYLKPGFWFYTDWINVRMIDATNTELSGTAAVPYRTDDPTYFAKQQQNGLSVSDTGEKGAFRFIHLLGSHTPYVMDEKGNRIDQSVGTVEGQTRGAFLAVSDYLRRLKELGLYDQATIIITADHGQWISSIEDEYWTSSPIMLVKPAGAPNEPLKESTVQTGHVDFPATVLQAAGVSNYSDYGLTVWEAPQSGRVRNYYHLTHDPYSKIDYDLQEFEISGNVLDFKNWRLTGNNITITPMDEATAKQKAKMLEDRLAKEAAKNKKAA